MNIKDLPLNDPFAQYIRSLNTTPENANIKREKMLSCNHLFVKLKREQKEYQILSEVECVHCGLTNKYHSLENFFRIKQMASDQYKERTLESILFDEIMNIPNLNLISDEVIETNHPGLLYQLALTINPEANQDELFTIMNTLHNLENEQERLHLRRPEQSSALLKRYKSATSKTLKRKK